MPDIDGQVHNEYAGSRKLALEAPAAPWAMYLAGTDRRYRFLAFDLDAKGGRGPADADRDARALAATLQGAGLAPVVCESGPSGGRHVWVGLDGSVEADTVATLARLLRHTCPSLDIAPLTNPVTGCVRPPGSPHRHGGASTVLSGHLGSLTDPQGGAEQVRALVSELAGQIDPPATEAPASGPVPVDAHGRLYLPGARRALPAASAAALDQDASHPDADASTVLWRVLVGAASAHWRYAEIAGLAETAPGLEHVRSTRTGHSRAPRSQDQAEAVLRRQWDKAVRWAASAPKQAGADPTFDARADAIAAHVRGVQERADASVGRWATAAGPTDRRVLDVLCLLALQAVSAEVEADTRRVALLAGISRDTSSKALHRLSAHGWLVRTRPSEGSRAAVWSIDPQDVLHREPVRDLTQADPRPVGAGSAERSTLLAHLESRIEAGRHDAFTPGTGLGVLAGNLYARLGSDPKNTLELSRALGLPPARTHALLQELEMSGLARPTGQGWIRPSSDRRDTVAALRGCTGRLQARADAYRLERALWAWWLAELAWMRTPRPADATKAGQTSLRPAAELNTRGRYPRHRNGRADHHAARLQLATEHQDPATATAAPLPTKASMSSSATASTSSITASSASGDSGSNAA